MLIRKVISFRVNNFEIVCSRNSLFSMQNCHTALLQKFNFLPHFQHDCQVRSGLANDVQVSEVRVKQVGKQGQQSGSISEAVSWVADELHCFAHRVL